MKRPGLSIIVFGVLLLLLAVGEAVSTSRAMDKTEIIIPLVKFEDAPVEEVLAYLTKKTEVTITIGGTAREKLEAVPGGARVTINSRDATLKSNLHKLLTPYGLTYVVGGSELIVVPKDSVLPVIDDPPREKEFLRPDPRLLKEMASNLPKVKFLNESSELILGELGKKIGARVVVAKSVGSCPLYRAVGPPITLKLKDVPVQQVLEIVIEQKGACYFVEGNTITVASRYCRPPAANVPDRKAFTKPDPSLIAKLSVKIPKVNFTRARVDEILDFLSRKVDANIAAVLPPELCHMVKEPIVTLRLTDSSFQTVLEKVLDQAGLTYIIEGNVIKVVLEDSEDSD